VPSGPTLERATLTVFHTSDLHSHVFPQRFVASSRDQALGLGEAGEPTTAGGFARLGALLEVERLRAERSLYLDSGDLFQGSLVYDRFGGEAELVGMAALRLDAMVLGNHDLDDGAEPLAELIERFGTFPVLSTNYVSATRSSPYVPWVIFDVGGLRVGVVGVANVESVGALERGSDALGLLPRVEAEALRETLALLSPISDVTLALSHLGLDGDRALVRETWGLDLVLGGHQHLALEAPEFERDAGGREVPIVHSGAYGRYLGRVRLSLARGRLPELGLERVGFDYALLPVAEGSPESQEIARVLAPYGQVIESEDRAFAYVESALARRAPGGGDSGLANLVADAAWLAAPGDLALVTSSSLRADLAPGPLTPSALYEALPFDDPLVRVVLRGRDLERLYEALSERAVRYGCETPVLVAGAALRFRCGKGVVEGGLFPVRGARTCSRDADCEGGRCAPSSSGARHCFRKAPSEALFRLVTTRFLLEDYAVTARAEIVGATLRSAVEQRLASGAPQCPDHLPCVRAPAVGRVEMGGK
jgi:5'-nucleotidase/UDP-sugar diphosphatase